MKIDTPSISYERYEKRGLFHSFIARKTAKNGGVRNAMKTFIFPNSQKTAVFCAMKL